MKKEDSMKSAYQEAEKISRSLKRNVFLPMCIVMVVVLFLALTFFKNHNKHAETEYLEDLVGNVDDFYKDALTRDNCRLSQAIDTLISNKSVVSALSRRDRKELFAISAPMFEKYKKDHSTNKMFFFDQDGRVVLRVHIPEEFGDPVSRTTLNNAKKTGSMSWGVELDRLDTPVLVVIEPVFHNGSLVGFIGLAEDIESLATIVSKNLGCEIFSVIDKKYLNKDKWETGIKKSGKKENWNEFNNYAIVGRTKDAVPLKFIKLIESGEKWNEKDVKLFKEAGRQYGAGKIPLKNVLNNDIGYFFILFDNSSSLEHEMAFDKKMILAFILSASVMLFILYRILEKTEKTLRERNSAVADAGNQLEKINALLLTDIEKREKAETALKSNEKFLSTITSAVNDSIIMINGEGEVVFWNPAAEKMFGFSSEYVIGKNLHELIAPDELMEAHSVNFSIFKTTGVGNAVGKTVVLPALRAGGEEFIAELSLAAVPLEGCWGAIGVVRDITDRRRSERELGKLTKAVEFNPSIIIITDINGAIEYVNPKFTAVTGYSFAEVKGKNPRILKSGNIPSEEYAQLWQTITSGGEFRGEFSNKRKNGEIYWQFGSILPIRNSSGEISNFLAVMEDITDKKFLDEEMENLMAEQDDLLRQIAEKNEDLEAFAYTVSHDLKAPLVTIDGFANAIIEDYNDKLDDNGKRYISRIIGSVEKLKAMIDDILDYSRVGTMDEETCPVSMATIVSNAIDMLSGQIASSGVKISFENVETELYGSRARLQQVFQNLISNSIKYIGNDNPSPEITIGTKNIDGTKVMFVKDNGIGIEKEDQTKVFQIFKRVGNTKNAEGTGVGLATVKRIIDKHKGKIWVESEPGKGSVFFFTVADEKG